jgi:hypothetical protein
MQTYLPFWQVLLPREPEFFIGYSQVSWVDHKNLSHLRLGWCHEQQIHTVVLDLAPKGGRNGPPFDPLALAKMEAKMEAGVVKAVAEDARTVFVAPFLNYGTKEYACFKDWHTSGLAKAAQRTFNVPTRVQEGKYRINLIQRQRPNGTANRLPPTDNDPCKPRGVRNGLELRERFGGMCNQTGLCTFRETTYEQLNFAGQIQAAASTDIYISYYGSGLSNALWLPDGSVAVEIMPKGHISSGAAMGVEDTNRNITWVFATDPSMMTFQSYERMHSYWRPWYNWNRTGDISCGGWPMFGTDRKDTCRAWNATNVLDMLRYIMATCDLRLPGADKEGTATTCLRSAMVTWQGDPKHTDYAQWVLNHTRYGEHRLFLEIFDDGKGRDDPFRP